jgi:hypothetical protein
MGRQRVWMSVTGVVQGMLGCVGDDAVSVNHQQEWEQLEIWYLVIIIDISSTRFQ